MQIPIPALLFALALHAASSHAGGGDRVFADGFEPCCRIGGVAGNVVGNGLVVRLDAGSITEQLPLAPSASPRYFAFVQGVPPGSAYSVSIQDPPAAQTCTITNGSGTVADAPVDDVVIQCGSPDGMFWNSGRWNSDTWQ